MTDVIHLLPDSVANQIAAGEVIQRPASIIKELIENSLDAGATRIQVIVTDAGKSCVQVIDNGKGMSDTDARLSFERHATSKITSAEDLFSLTTMGFRGEALASIAAVAQVELRTRQADQELGVSIQIEGSKFIKQEAIACPVGANFIVNNLFFNIPARRKFLKSNHTELAQITAEFERIALAHPEVSFSLSTPESMLLDLPESNFKQRIVNVFGRKLEKFLIPVQVETSLVSISGFVGNLESSKKKGVHQFFFCNGRFMRHHYFAKAVQTAFERLIPEGEQIPFFLQFVVDPSKIDVNIHPTKTEIKFEDESSIWQVLLAAIREALGRYNAIPSIDFDIEHCPEIPVYDGAVRNVPMPRLTIDTSFNPFNLNSAPPSEQVSTPTNTKNSSGSSHTFSPRASIQGWEKIYNDTITSGTFDQGENQDEIPLLETPTLSPALYESLDTAEQQTWETATAQYIQYKGRYIISPSENGLLIVDQHRAHIRILYDQYMEQVNNQHTQTQRMLFPLIIEFPPSQCAIMQTIESELTDIGFDLSFLGGGSYSILGVPTGIDGLDPIVLLQNIIDDAAQKPTDIREEVLSSLSLSLAKKAAIPVGQALSNEEMCNLVTQLFSRTSYSFTPDGKSTISILAHTTITKSFD